jgi:hypothetical protein
MYIICTKNMRCISTKHVQSISDVLKYCICISTYIVLCTFYVLKYLRCIRTYDVLRQNMYYIT